MGIVSAFADRFATVPLNPLNPVMSNAQAILRVNVGGSTMAYLAIKYLVDNKIDVDRIVILSDMQCYNEIGYWRASDTLQAMFKKYKTTVNPNVYLYSIDLAGYGTLQFPEDEARVCLLAGFSPRVYEFVKLYEEFGVDLINRIENYHPE